MYKRDYQRSKVYRAETATRTKYMVNRYYLIEECVEYLTVVLESIDFTGKSDTVVVKNGSRNALACIYDANIMVVLPMWARTPIVILHELAHHIVHRSYPSGTVSWHGPEFCAVLAWLIKNFEPKFYDSYIENLALQKAKIAETIPEGLKYVPGDC